jgi:foldase protein PrsA
MMSIRQYLMGLSFLCVSLSLTSCKLSDQARSFFLRNENRAAVIQIGSKTYSRADLDRFFDSRLSEFRDPGNADEVKSNLLESFVEEKLLLQRAEQKSVKPSAQVVNAMMARIIATGADHPEDRGDTVRHSDFERSVTESLTIQQYLSEYLLKGLTTSDQECNQYYQAHLGEYFKKDVVHVREILVEDHALAERLLSLLKTKRNKNFQNLARAYSKGASAAEGGDLGRFQRGELPQEFEKAIFALTPGTVSRIVRTRYGYHIFLLDEKVLAHQAKLIEVADQIKEKLRVEREREIINRELEAARKEIPVAIHREQLDFKYIGTRY